MNKKIMLLSVGILLFALTGCQGNSNQSKPETNSEVKQVEVEPGVELSKEEKELANGNPNIGAQLLVRKAVLAEIKTAALNEKEKFEMEFVKDEAAISYYLHKTLGEKIEVSEDAIKKVYEENKEKLGERKLEDVHDEIKAAIVNNVQSERLTDYYNGLVEKYKLNDSLKKEFSEPQAEDKK
ncbi:hypothetical protein [Fusobacterium sp.]|uniref:hypothetical protein n=1 Tax=Fusobacterium sp. TaxID=68766 RepID=UPI00396C6DCB